VSDVAGFLVVRAGAERYAFNLAGVEEIVDLGEPAVVPGRLPAFRGVIRWRERHLSVLHLGALLGGTAAPASRGDTAVVLRLGGRPVALEVDAVEDVIEPGTAGTAAGATVAAAGVWQVGGALVTILDLDALTERLAERRENA
jgi:chemotaxis signal transduction protein